MTKSNSSISGIFSRYREALKYSQDRYTDLYTNRAQNSIEFYENFLHHLLVDFQGFGEGAEPLLRQVREDIRGFFNQDEIQFVAIDGSCDKDPFTDFMVFSSIAYGVRGEIGVEGDPPKIRYKRRSIDEDVSFVAYVPIPFAEIEDVANSERLEDFVMSDTDKIDISNIHTSLMQLAEIFLAYEIARSSAPDRARLILMDHSPSSIMASAELDTDKIPLLGNVKVGRTIITKQDAVVVFAHPFNENLGLPSVKNFRLYNTLIADVVRRKIGKFGGEKQVKIPEFLQSYGINEDDWVNHYRRNSKVIRSLGDYDSNKGVFTPKTEFDFDESWRTSVMFFEEICFRLFKDKDQTALTYTVKDEYGQERQRWMSPDDIKFLIAIGIRALVEVCWKRDVMLLGIVKDSQSRYFSRNYYGVMREMGVYPKIDVKPLPWTDRIILEDIILGTQDLQAPWSTIEFDACFMTLHLEKDDDEELTIRGVRGDIVNQERVFARSLGQFFLRRRPEKSDPLMGHVIFIDRLLSAHWDKGLLNVEDFDIYTPELGILKPFLHIHNEVDNAGQRVAMYVLNILTRNLFPEAIGYPDPLHKADWGAKTVKRQVSKIIGDSEIAFKSRPLIRSFRSIRDNHKR